MGQTVNARTFLDLYFGEGMASIWTEGKAALCLAGQGNRLI